MVKGKVIFEDEEKVEIKYPCFELKDVVEYYFEICTPNNSINPFSLVALPNANTLVSIYLSITSVNIQAYYQELKKDSEKIDFIFNDMVYLFLASGFNGAYIIVDDFERIPDFQSDRQKRDFALEIRRNFFDGTSANARIGFYNLLLMLHAGVPRLIEKAWSESGMEQRSSISPSSAVPHIIYFNKLDKNRAILLIKKYLTEYRINKEDSIQPFTESAIAKIGEEKEYNAAQMLGLAYMLLENAAKNNIKTIDVAEVTHMLKKSEIEVKTAENIIDENSSDLLNKANQE